MTFTQLLLLLIIFLPLALVLLNKLRMDLAAILMAVALAVLQALGLGVLGPAGSPKEAVKAFSGFSQPVIFTLFGLFVMIYSLEKSGAAQWLAGKLLRTGSHTAPKLAALLATATAVLSLLMNNLAAGALLLPVAIELSKRTQVKPSKLLIPVAYGSLLGGMATYFTTANMIVSGLLPLAEPPQKSLSILAFTPTGGLIAVAGILFIYLIGHRLLPENVAASEQLLNRLTGDQLEDFYGLGDRMWEARILLNSPLRGRPLADFGLGQKLGITVAAIQRGGKTYFAPDPSALIQEEDNLMLIGRAERVTQIKDLGLVLCREAVTHEHISARGMRVAELVLSPHSQVTGKTLKMLDFRKQYKLTVLALRRGTRNYRTDIGDMPLQFGDSLLVVGQPTALAAVANATDFILLEPAGQSAELDKRSALIGAGVLTVAIAASIAGVPIFLCMVIGALLIILSGMVSIHDVYQRMEWSVLFLIAGMYAVSQAMVHTGLAASAADLILDLVAPLGPLGLAAGAFLLSAALAQVMGGQVTILVSGPIFISAALAMGVNPQAVAVAAAIGCSAAYLTPMAHPVNLLVMVPGSYKLRDFVKIGLPLFLLTFVVLLLGILLFWQL